MAIARAAVNKPAILLADEPTGNLDPATSAGIMNVLSRINASGTTVLMATHDAGIVNQMQRRVVEISAGRIVRDENQGGYQTTSIPLGELDTAPTPVANPTGAVKVDISPSGEPVYDIVSPAAWDFLEAAGSALKGAGRARVLVCGTLAQRHPVGRQALRLLVPLNKRCSRK